MTRGGAQKVNLSIKKIQPPLFLHWAHPLVIYEHKIRGVQQKILVVAFLYGQICLSEHSLWSGHLWTQIRGFQQKILLFLNFYEIVYVKFILQIILNNHKVVSTIYNCCPAFLLLHLLSTCWCSLHQFWCRRQGSKV